MASPSSLRELRIMEGTTLNTTFANAAAGNAWDIGAAVTKVRITKWDGSGLVQDGIPDVTLRTRMYGKYAAVPGLGRGAAKFSTYFSGAYANVTETPEMRLANCCMGGLLSPSTNKSGTIGGATKTTSNIDITDCNTYLQPGQGVLIGKRGDGRGNGEVRVVSFSDAAGCNFYPALSVAANENDTAVYGHTAYLDEDSTQRYLDLLAIGRATADQRQTIGGVVKLGISSTGAGELPSLDWDYQCSGHRIVPSALRATIATTTAPQGQDPTVGGVGYVHLSNCQCPTRTQIKISSFSVEPGVDYMVIPDPAGVAGVGGYQKIPGAPTAKLTMLFDEQEPNLTYDFNASVAKSMIIQIGHSATKCVAIDMPRCYLTEAPKEADASGLAAVEVSLQGDESNVTTNDLTKSPLRIHFF